MGLWNAFGRESARAVAKSVKALAPKESEIYKDFDFLHDMVKREDAEIAAEKAAKKSARK